MSRSLLRLCAGLLTLCLTLTSCSGGSPAQSASVPPPAPARSEPAQTPAPDLSEQEKDLSALKPAGQEPPSLPAQEALAQPEPPSDGPVLTQEDVDRALAEVMEDYSAAAVSVATIENGALSCSGAWGWAVKDEREMTPQTKVRVASLSKVVLSMCAMAMVEDGMLELDGTLDTYWGKGVDNPRTKTQPTVRSLLTHSSSLKAMETTSGLSTLRDILKDDASWRGVSPGTPQAWYYSNFGFCVLGTTLELASQRILDDYLQDRFFRPLGIEASFHAAKLGPDLLAELYTPSAVGRSIQRQVTRSIPEEIGDGANFFPGGLTISAEDMARLVSILAGDGQLDGVRCLSPQSVEAMETPHFTVEPGETSDFQQCLALRLQEDLLGRSSIYYHTGSAYGVFSLLTYDPETGDGVVVITTGTPRKTDEHGLYALCADLSARLYARMENPV